MENAVQSSGDAPVLSILIPSYNYPEGVGRILRALYPWDNDACEVVIADDSSDSGVADEVRDFIKISGQKITYYSNFPPKGAVANWNSLVSGAHGKYCLLMHHDECPIAANFTENLIRRISESPDVDVGVLDLILVREGSLTTIRHVPSYFRMFVLIYIPGYIFRRNVIGPVSSLVIRRSCFPKFNEQLRWLVDVDMYFRLIAKSNTICSWTDLNVLSIINRTDSITARLAPGLQVCIGQERGLLMQSYGDVVWLNEPARGMYAVALLYVFESFFWNIFRVVQKIAKIFSGNILHKNSLKQFFR